MAQALPALKEGFPWGGKPWAVKDPALVWAQPGYNATLRQEQNGPPVPGPEETLQGGGSLGRGKADAAGDKGCLPQTPSSCDLDSQGKERLTGAEMGFAEQPEGGLIQD